MDDCEDVVSSCSIDISSTWNDSLDEIEEVVSVDWKVFSSESEFKLRLRYFERGVGVGCVSVCVDSDERNVGHV